MAKTYRIRDTKPEFGAGGLAAARRRFGEKAPGGKSEAARDQEMARRRIAELDAIEVTGGELTRSQRALRARLKDNLERGQK